MYIFFHAKLNQFPDFRYFVQSVPEPDRVSISHWNSIFFLVSPARKLICQTTNEAISLIYYHVWCLLFNTLLVTRRPNWGNQFVRISYNLSTNTSYFLNDNTLSYGNGTPFINRLHVWIYKVGSMTFMIITFCSYFGTSIYHKHNSIIIQKTHINPSVGYECKLQLNQSGTGAW